MIIILLISVSGHTYMHTCFSIMLWRDTLIFFPLAYYLYTVRFDRLEIVKYLIEVQGCSAGCTDNSGQNPLHLACR